MNQKLDSDCDPSCKSHNAIFSCALLDDRIRPFSSLFVAFWNLHVIFLKCYDVGIIKYTQTLAEVDDSSHSETKQLVSW